MLILTSSCRKYFDEMMEITYFVYSVGRVILSRLRRVISSDSFYQMRAKNDNASSKMPVSCIFYVKINNGTDDEISGKSLLC